MPFALPTNLTSEGEGLMYGFSLWASQVSGGTFWTFMLLAFMVAIVGASIRLGVSRAYAFAGFIGVVGSVFLVVAKLMPWEIASLFIINGVIAAAVMKLSERV